jgi:WD40 repeat protein
VIEQAPLQLYYSSLVFAPDKSVVKRLFEKPVLTSIQMKPKVQGNWSAVLQTLESGSGSVNIVVFSLDGQLLGTASDKETRLWDPETGASRGVLKGQLGQVKAMAFSPNSQLLAIASDKEVKLWDPIAKTSHSVLKG